MVIVLYYFICGITNFYFMNKLKFQAKIFYSQYKKTIKFQAQYNVK